MGTHPLTAPWCRTRCQRFTALCSRVPGSAGTGVPLFLATSDPGAVYLGAGLFPVLSFLPLAAEFCTVCAGRARPGVGDAAPSARSAMARHAGPRLPLIVKNLVPTLSSVFDSQRITTTAFFAEVRRGGGRCCLSVCLSVRASVRHGAAASCPPRLPDPLAEGMGWQRSACRSPTLNASLQ